MTSTPHGMNDDDLVGVWIQPTGTRVDITRHGATWRGTVAVDRRALIRPYGSVIWDKASEVRAYIATAEGDGFVRQQATSPRTAPPATYAERWTLPRLIGPIILLIVIVAVGIAIIG